MSAAPAPTLPRLCAAALGEPINQRPERVLQFGEGGFLRGFVDWMLHRLNERGLFNGAVVVVQPLPTGLVSAVNRQDGLFTHILRGVEGGRVREDIEIVRSIRRGIDPFTDFAGYLACARNPDLRYIVSNTTEAGIACHPGDRLDAAPPVSFPAKLTRLLMERQRVFGDAPAADLVVLPCELIESNGTQLKKCVLETSEKWALGRGFADWIEKHVRFCNTLVDRIVTGYPREEAAALCARLGYEDALLNTSEMFHAWVIEGPASLADELPFAAAGLNVVFTPDYKPYRDRKVRILNGAHTGTVLAGHLAGHTLVKDLLDDPEFASFLNRMLQEEILPTLDLPRADLQSFAAAVLERFANPFVKHPLLSIALNSTSKFTARILPSLLTYRERTGTLPKRLVVALAALIAFYRGFESRDGALVGQRAAGDTYRIQDSPEVLEFFLRIWNQPGATPASVTTSALAHAPLWGGKDLRTVPGLEAAVAETLTRITKSGVRTVIAELR